MKKTILVTGSNGLLGQKLVKLITDKNEYQLIATAKGDNRLPADEDYIYQSLDITNKEEIENLITKVNPNYIIHTAAMTNVDQCESEKEACIKLNVDAVRYLKNVCEEKNIFLLHLSTDFIFDGENGPYDEEAEGKPLSFYGESKLEAEKILIESKGPWAIARTVLVYGIANDMSRSNIILWVKKSLEDGKTINVVDDQWRTPTLAEDLAMGCYLIIKNEAKGIYNISGDELLTPYQMALQTADFFKLDKNLINRATAATFTQPAKRPPRTGFIITKAREKLNYNPVNFNEGIGVLASQIL